MELERSKARPTDNPWTCGIGNARCMVPDVEQVLAETERLTATEIQSS